MKVAARSAQYIENRPVSGALYIVDRRYFFDSATRDEEFMIDIEPQWSDSLQETTRAALNGLAVLPHQDFVALKHIDGRFGAIAISDLLRSTLRVSDRRSGQETTFANVDELIRAGWAID